MSQAELPRGPAGSLFGRLMGWLDADMERRAMLRRELDQAGFTVERESTGRSRSGEAIYLVAALGR